MRNTGKALSGVRLPPVCIARSAGRHAPALAECERPERRSSGRLLWTSIKRAGPASLDSCSARAQQESACSRSARSQVVQGTSQTWGPLAIAGAGSRRPACRANRVSGRAAEKLRCHTNAGLVPRGGRARMPAVRRKERRRTRSARPPRVAVLSWEQKSHLACLGLVAVPDVVADIAEEVGEDLRFDKDPFCVPLSMASRPITVGPSFSVKRTWASTSPSPAKSPLSTSSG
jgi:hypothetical protein